jgi:hypothetical protein
VRGTREAEQARHVQCIARVPATSSRARGGCSEWSSQACGRRRLRGAARTDEVGVPQVDWIDGHGGGDCVEAIGCVRVVAWCSVQPAWSSGRLAPKTRSQPGSERAGTTKNEQRYDGRGEPGAMDGTDATLCWPGSRRFDPGIPLRCSCTQSSDRRDGSRRGGCSACSCKVAPMQQIQVQRSLWQNVLMF